jgi:hypothetical protein
MSEEANIARILEASTLSTKFSQQLAFDVTPLVPAAQKIVRAVSYLFWREFGSQLIGVLVYGSALKGGEIPGCGDIDIRIYVERAAVDEYGAPLLEQALRLQRSLAKIDIKPFLYVQTYVTAVGVENERTRGDIGPVAGAYHMVYGRLPEPEATTEQIVQQAHATLARVAFLASDKTQALLDQGKLERSLQLLCTDVWPALYSVLTLQSDEPAAIWCQSKPAVMNMLPRQTPMGLEIHRFHQCLVEYYSDEPTLSAALAAMEHGIRFLQAVAQWYTGSQQEVQA